MAPHLVLLAHHTIKVKQLRARLLAAPADALIAVEGIMRGARCRKSRLLAMARYKQGPNFTL